MINIVRQGSKIIGVYQIFLSHEEIVTIYPDSVKEYVFNKLYDELKKDDSSDLFAYNIINGTNKEDLFGLNCEVIFEFVPNKEKVEELKIVTERLIIGL